MASKYHSEIGRINGKYYKLVYDRRGNQMASDYPNEWRWFLWVGGNNNDYYEGDFKTKHEAIESV